LFVNFLFVWRIYFGVVFKLFGTFTRSMKKLYFSIVQLMN
jgi:hypothetical protein